MFPSAKGLTRLWGAITTDCEMVTELFMGQPGFLFRDFAEVAKDVRLSLVMNICIGQGKHKEENYEVTASIIFNAALQIWLGEGNPKNIGGKSILKFKRQLCGLYLTYAMYLKQPFAGRAKIPVDAGRLEAIRKFMKEVEEYQGLPTEIKRQVKFAFSYLKGAKAFSYTYDWHEYGVEAWQRSLITAQNSEVMKVSFAERDVLDTLAYPFDSESSRRQLADYEASKAKIFSVIGSKFGYTSMYDTMFQQGEGASLFEKMKDPSASSTLQSSYETFKEIGSMRLVTFEQAVLNQVIHRRIMAEFRQRIQSCRKRVVEGNQKPKREYVKAGSIWGRKKPEEEGEERRRRRERGGFSRNVFIYLNNLPFSYSEDAECPGVEVKPGEEPVQGQGLEEEPGQAQGLESDETGAGN